MIQRKENFTASTITTLRERSMKIAYPWNKNTHNASKEKVLSQRMQLEIINVLKEDQTNTTFYFAPQSQTLRATFYDEVSRSKHQPICRNYLNSTTAMQNHEDPDCGKFYITNKL